MKQPRNSLLLRRYVGRAFQATVCCWIVGGCGGNLNCYGNGFGGPPPLVAKIAFTTDRDGNGQIYLMNADGTGPVNLSNNASEDFDPAWSPDGTKIAFTNSSVGSNVEVYVMNADGTGRVGLTNTAGFNSQPAWSPDGTKIAFTSTRDGNYEVYVMNADGTSQVSLTNNAAFDAKAYPESQGS